MDAVEGVAGRAATWRGEEPAMMLRDTHSLHSLLRPSFDYAHAERARLESLAYV
jgi:hypothetical protein